MDRNTDRTTKLKDGRTLGYAEYGDSRGRVLFYFHGHPGSRFEAGFLAEHARRNNVRLIAMDRPGLGLSTYNAGRRIVGWADDVKELANYLHIDRFGVVGFSGGGPYALACAYRMPDRLISCGVVSGVARTSLFVSFLARWMPWLMLPMIEGRFANVDRARKSMAQLTKRWPIPDQRAFAQPNVRDTMIASLMESFRQGTKGAAYDGMLIGARNWGFELKSLTLRNIHWWHGELDDQIRAAQAREVVESITHCVATFYPNEAHISTIADHGEEIVVALMGNDK
jgi:pimeloyl-ACP methyl ester carboxylesterase